MSSISINGTIYKMNNNIWRVCIPNDLPDINYTNPYYGFLEKKYYNFTDCDDDDYIYQIDSDDEYIYCYAYTENCARAGIIDFIKIHHSSLNMHNKLLSIEYSLYNEIIGIYWQNLENTYVHNKKPSDNIKNVVNINSWTDDSMV